MADSIAYYSEKLRTTALQLLLHETVEDNCSTMKILSLTIDQFGLQRDFGLTATNGEFHDIAHLLLFEQAE